MESPRKLQRSWNGNTLHNPSIGARARVPCRWRNRAMRHGEAASVGLLGGPRPRQSPAGIPRPTSGLPPTRALQLLYYAHYAALLRWCQSVLGSSALIATKSAQVRQSPLRPTPLEDWLPPVRLLPSGTKPHNSGRCAGICRSGHSPTSGAPHMLDSRRSKAWQLPGSCVGSYQDKPRNSRRTHPTAPEPIREPAKARSDGGWPDGPSPLPTP